MLFIAPHHRESTRPKGIWRNSLHLCQNLSLNHYQLFFRGVVVPRNEAIWRSFQDHSRRPDVGITILYGRAETFDVGILLELHIRNGIEHALFCSLGRHCRGGSEEQTDEMSYPYIVSRHWVDSETRTLLLARWARFS